MTDTIGFVGLGTMGSGMARNLLEKGHSLVTTSSSSEKAAAFKQLGADIVASVEEMTGAAKTIITCVPQGKDLLGLVDRIAGSNWDGGLLIDCSTVSPDEVIKAGRALEAVGAHMLDAPISGGAKGAAEGTLTIMCGGDEADFARATPVFEAIGRTIRLCGPLGAGQAVKACNQLMVVVNLMGVCEAIALARSVGVDPKLMREVVLTGTGRSASLEVQALRYLDGELDGGFRSELMRKDLGIAAEIGRARHRTMPATALAHQMIVASCNAGFATLDSAALGRLYDILNDTAS